MTAQPSEHLLCRGFDQFGFVRFERGNGGIAFHGSKVARTR
jgi:hypothetical protein